MLYAEMLGWSRGGSRACERSQDIDAKQIRLSSSAGACRSRPPATPPVRRPPGHWPARRVKPKGEHSHDLSPSYVGPPFGGVIVVPVLSSGCGDRLGRKEGGRPARVLSRLHDYLSLHAGSGPNVLFEHQYALGNAQLVQ